MSRENEDFHGHFLNFTHEYLRVTMRGLPRVSEVTPERYRSYMVYFSIIICMSIIVICIDMLS